MPTTGAKVCVDGVAQGVKEGAKAVLVHLAIHTKLHLPESPDDAVVHESPTQYGEPVGYLHGLAVGIPDPAYEAVPLLPRWLGENRK